MNLVRKCLFITFEKGGLENWSELYKWQSIMDGKSADQQLEHAPFTFFSFIIHDGWKKQSFLLSAQQHNN